MRKLLVMLAIAALPGLPAGAAAAAAPGQPPASEPDITVTGEDRMVCRYVTRTATRMRRGRVCRKLSDWGNDSDRAVRNANDPHATIDGVADTLETIGQRSALRDDGVLGPR